jgi:hypothetical protein
MRKMTGPGTPGEILTGVGGLRGLRGSRACPPVSSADPYLVAELLPFSKTWLARPQSASAPSFVEKEGQRGCSEQAEMA